MIVIAGCIIVLGAVVGGFTISGGHVGALIHPAELLTIGGASLGALVLGSPKKVLIDMVKACLNSFKGSPYSKPAYEELFKCTYDLLRVARRDGLIALESHVTDPHASSIFGKYPRIGHNHHVTNFLCGAMTPLIEGTANAQQLNELLELELRVIDEEHHAPIGVLTKTADALPGFGIVAAVLGIVITMGHIDGPVEEIGEKVGAALVGTFLGILLSYGFVAPLAGRLTFLGASEIAFFRTIVTIVVSFANNLPPKVAIDQARRSVGTEVRPTRNELDDLFKEVEAAA